MQVLDEEKRSKIINAAAELFASNPFHKVLLSQVAEAASVGKGTLYLYFANKDDLYLSVIYSGFSELVEGIQHQVHHNKVDPAKNLEAAVRQIVQFAYQNPHVFELMRTVPQQKDITRTQWISKRSELKSLIESIIRSGIEAEIFNDTHPELTARYIPGMVRTVMMENPRNVDPQEVTKHIMGFILAALMTKGASK